MVEKITRKSKKSNENEKSCAPVIMEKKLKDFLFKHEVYPKNGDIFSHTSKLNPRRSYFISPEEYNTFFDLYNNVINNNGVLGLTEKPENIVPMIVDIDFKYQASDLQRVYKTSHVKAIISIYQNIIREITISPSEEMFYCCVLEKNAPVLLENGVYKDGIHLHFPYFFTEQWVQKNYIRNRVINEIEQQGVFNDIELIEKTANIFDKNVPGNVWLMYGSRKEDSAQAYLLKTVFNENLKKIPLSQVFEQIDNIPVELDLARHLSIRLDVEGTPLKQFVLDSKQVRSVKVSRKRPFKRNEQDIVAELVTVGHIVREFISKTRADNYTEWMELGWILFNISEGHSNGLQIWIDFSKNSRKFRDGECEKEWDKMEIRNYNFDSLKYLAKQDSPKEYDIWKRETQVNPDIRMLSTAHNDIAKILFKLFGREKYVCADIEKDVWYEFNNHRWHKMAKGIGLRKAISYELSNEYARYSGECLQRFRECTDELERPQWNTRTLIACKIVEKLKNCSFKNAVMKEAMEYFYDKDFVEKMDENPYLLACENGVYDTETRIFRDGRPDDYCTKSTHLWYDSTLSEDDPRFSELMHIFKTIFVNPKLFRFFKQTVSDLVRGGNRHKIFVIWTGCGDNGKSVCADLLEKAFGDYYYSPPTSLLTGKQQQSSGATAELIPCKGARVVQASETGNEDTMNCGTMKKMTSGDTMYARGLFKEPVKILPHYKLILHCNKLPNVSAEDKATWNRIRILPFESKFVKEGDYPKSKKEQIKEKTFPMDRTLKDRLNDLAEVFLWWLIKTFEELGDSDLYEPEEVKAATDIYRKNNDFFFQFLDERIKQTESNTDIITISTVYTVFKDWFKESFPGRQIPPRNQVKEALEKKLGSADKGTWYNYTIYDPEEDAKRQIEETDNLGDDRN